MSTKMKLKTMLSRKHIRWTKFILALGLVTLLWIMSRESDLMFVPGRWIIQTEPTPRSLKTPSLVLDQPQSTIRIEYGTGHYKLDKPTGKVPGTYSWSQIGQDKFVDKHLKGRRNGFFVEIGGYDGEGFSNSLFFEQKRNWTGLLVEANPYLYKRMVAKERACAMAHACISRALPTMDFKLAGPITAAVNTLSAAHLRRINDEAKVMDKNHGKGYGSIVATNCTTLDALLQELSVKHVDYFSLDVEGAEMLVLESIDWDKMDVDIFTIETQEHRAEIITFMIGHGYIHVNPRPLSDDDVFLRRAR